MSIERDLLKQVMGWMFDLSDIYANERSSDDRIKLMLKEDISKIKELLAQPEQEPLELAEVMRKKARLNCAAQFNEGLRVGQREAKRMLLEMAQVKQDYLNENEILTNLLLEAEDKIQELLAQPEQTEQEDIRYGWRDAYEAGLRFAKREPLSNEWLKDNIGFIHRDVSFTDLVRAIEKAHGIGVDDES